MTGDLDGTIDNPNLLGLYHYWQAKRGSRRWPTRGDIDPLEMPSLLGSIILIDVQHSPLRFRYRLTGTKLVQTAGYNLYGKGPEHIPNAEYRALVTDVLTRVATTGRPVAWSGERSREERTWHYDALMLPLSSDGAVIDMLLGAQLYQPIKQRTNSPGTD